MKEKTQTTMLRRIKQRIYSFYKQQDKKRMGELVPLNGSYDFDQDDHFDTPILEITEIPGHRYHVEELYPMHDLSLEDYSSMGSPVTKRAIDLDGNLSNYYALTADSRKDSNEINVSLIYGQMFSTVYPGSVGGIGQSANFGHYIDFDGPLDRDIFIKVHTYASIVNEKEKVFHLDRGNCGLEVLGIEGYIQTGLYVQPVNNEDDTSTMKFHKFLDVRETNDGRTEEFQSICTTDNIIRVPAGNSRVVYTAGVRGAIYGSKDFSDISILRNDQYGFAMLDLRHELRGSQTPILRDPLGSWNKQPFGGVKFFIRVEFFEAVV